MWREIINFLTWRFLTLWLSYRERTIAATFTALEKQKKRCYNERIQQIERGSPVIFGALDIRETKLSKEWRYFQNSTQDSIHFDQVGSYLSERWTDKPHVYLVASSTERSKVEGSLDSGVVYYYLYILYIDWLDLFYWVQAMPPDSFNC